MFKLNCAFLLRSGQLTTDASDSGETWGPHRAAETPENALCLRPHHTMKGSIPRITTQVVYSCTLLLRDAFILRSFVVCAIKLQRACHSTIRRFSRWSSALDSAIFDKKVKNCWAVSENLRLLSGWKRRCVLETLTLLPDSPVWLIQSLFLVGI